MTNPMTFSDALCEVRKAHRLLWSFYDRLIPACHSLMREFEPAIFYYSDYWALGNLSSNALSKPSRFCALPFLDMALLYGYNPKRSGWYNNPKKGDYLLILNLALDTAFREFDFDSSPDNMGIESAEFPDVGKAETQVFLTTVLCCRDTQPCNWFHDVYQLDWEYDFKKPAYFNVDDSEPQNKNTDFIAFSKEFDIEKDFASSQAIKQAAENYRSTITEKIPAMPWSG